MLDIGWPELFVVAAIALIVVGPKDLPRALRTIMQAIRKARGMASEFQRGIDDVVREADLEDLRKQVESPSDFNIGKEIEDAIDPDGDFGDQFRDVEKDLNESARTLTDETKPERATETMTESTPEPQRSEELAGPPPPPEPTPSPEPDVKKTEQTG